MFLLVMMSPSDSTFKQCNRTLKSQVYNRMAMPWMQDIVISQMLSTRLKNKIKSEKVITCHKSVAKK